MLHSGTLRHYLQILDKAAKACQGQQSSLLQKSVNYGRKKFYRIGPCSVFSPATPVSTELIDTIFNFVLNSTLIPMFVERWVCYS